jgi:hypothetical protein
MSHSKNQRNKKRRRNRKEDARLNKNIKAFEEKQELDRKSRDNLNEIFKVKKDNKNLVDKFKELFKRKI